MRVCESTNDTQQGHSLLIDRFVLSQWDVSRAEKLQIWTAGCITRSTTGPAIHKATTRLKIDHNRGMYWILCPLAHTPHRFFHDIRYLSMH